MQNTQLGQGTKGETLKEKLAECLQEKKIAALAHERALQERFKELAQLTRQLEKQRQAQSTSQQKIKKLTADLQAVTKSRQSLLNSLSWRVTTPLRKMRGLLKR